MPMSINEIYDLPLKPLITISAIVFVGYCWAGCIFLRPFLRMFVKNRDGSNDVVGYVLSCFGVFYGLLLGLIAVASYQNLSEVESNVAREVASLDALHQDVSTYPAPHGQNLRGCFAITAAMCSSTPGMSTHKAVFRRASRLESRRFTNACSHSSR